MRIRDRRAEDNPEINLVPMIDVILCLIIFFVITTTFDARSVLKLELPRATGERSDSKTQQLSLLINAEDRYFVDDREALRTDVESRSEEHTSELQSLMRISYAVFFLKKKTSNQARTGRIFHLSTHSTIRR